MMSEEEMHPYPDPEEAANASSFTSANAIALEEDQLGYNPQLRCAYDPQLRDDRWANKKKLKRRFEHIFDKYEQDFQGVGDEIDLSTGEIVVNNGHLQTMRNERDNGMKETPKSRLDTAACEPEQSDSNDFADESSDGDDEGSDDAASVVGDDGGADLDSPDAGLSQSLGHRPARKKRGRAEDSVIDSDPSNDILMPAENMLQQIPGLEDSVLDFQSNYKRGQAIDQDAIQALGMSIANQLASFMSRVTPSKSKKNLDRLDVHGELRAKGQSSKRRRISSPLPDLLGPSPNGKKSIWAPTTHARRQRRRRAPDAESPQPVEQSENDSAAPFSSGKETSVAPPRLLDGGDLRRCTNCNETSSVWRKGADGDLCNTCGMYFYRYGLMRPIASSSTDKELMTRGENPKLQQDTGGEVDPLERDWWLDYDSGCSQTRKKPIKLVGVKNSPFIIEEDALLIQLKEIDMVTWERMVSFFPGRSAYALQCRYSKKLRGQAPEARQILVDQGYRGSADDNGIVVFSYTRAPFTDEEDASLLKLRNEDQLEWDAIAESVPRRSQYMLERRYYQLSGIPLDDAQEGNQSDGSQRPSSRDSSVSLQKGMRYTDEEDSLIIKLREVDKLSWVKIMEYLDGRNAFSIQKRYIRVLCGRHPQSILPARAAYDHNQPAPDSSRSSRAHSLSLQNNEIKISKDSNQIQHSGDLQLQSAPGDHSNEEQQVQEEVQKQLYDQLESAVTLAQQDMRNGSGRRYQVLLPKKSELELHTVAAQSNVQSRPSPSLENTSASTGRKVAASKRWTTDESDLLVRLRKLGKSWQQIAVHLPGRTPVAAKTRHAVIVSQSKTNDQATASPLEDLPTLKHDATLLRQAAHNLRRYSEPVAPFEDGAHTLNDASSKADAPFEQSVDNIDKPRALPPPEENESHAHVYPETPIQAREIQPFSSSIGPTPAAMAYYATPARYNEQAHPYFLTMPPAFSSPLVIHQPVATVQTASVVPASATGFQRDEEAPVPKKVTKVPAGQQIPKSGKENRHPRGSHVSSTTDDEDLLPVAHPEDELRHGQASTQTTASAKISADVTHRDSQNALKASEQSVFDIAYVNAHPDENFYHRGRGRWVRGLLPSGAPNKTAVRGPDTLRNIISAVSAHKTSSTDSPADAHDESTNDDPEDSSLLSIKDTEGAMSSPLVLAKSPNKDSEIIPTPATAGSTLFSSTRKRSTTSSKRASGTPFAHRRIRHVTELSDGKRVVHTPMREVDDSEDELAF